jgi:hypothetical protein
MTDDPRVLAGLGVLLREHEHHLPQLVRHGHLQLALADLRGLAVLALAADAVRPAGDVEDVTLLRQPPAVVLQPLPRPLVARRALGDDVRRVERRRRVLGGGRAVLRGAHVAAVEAPARVDVARHLREPRGEVGVGLELPTPRAADVLLAEAPAHPVRRPGLRVVRQRVLWPGDEVRLPARQLRLGRGGHPEAEVRVPVRLLRRGQRGGQDQGREGRGGALQEGQHGMVLGGGGYPDGLREPRRADKMGTRFRRGAPGRASRGASRALHATR